MGPYCNFCGQRCFVHITNDWPEHIVHAYGKNTIAATCPGGQQHEKKLLGYCYNDVERFAKEPQGQEDDTATACFRRDFSQFTEAILRELARAEALHGHKWPSTSRDEWMLVVGEEFGELIKAVLESRWDDGQRIEAQDEAVQVAAMAFKLWENLRGR